MEERFDVPESVTSATVDSAAANEEFRRLVHPLYKTFDEQQYWSGLFVMPCDGRITSEFGLKRYINNAKTPSRHAGIDIANAKGTVVCAPNGGKVVFAQLLQLSGNTVVIEHGLGLKSYFFHMDSLAVKQGQMVEKGDKVGEIGTTGFSTGPHLHYQLMMFGASVNPWEAFDGTSGIYN